MKDPKVFVIGFHKTGLTSLGQALEILGYRVCHRAAPLREALGHEAMIALLEAKDYGPIFNVAKRYDAFHDNPWFWLYKELDTQFPGSKFILSTREEASWLQSASTYFGNSESDFRRLVYGKAGIVGNEALYLSRYASHQNEVRAWFKDRPTDFLEVDIVASPEWEVLCSFLNLPIPAQKFPHIRPQREASRPSGTIKTALKRFLKN